jgi:hypothetical protein
MAEIVITVKVSSDSITDAEEQYNALVKALLDLRGLDLPGVQISIVLTTVKTE